MLITCYFCDAGTGDYPSADCPICGGDGEIDVGESDFSKIKGRERRLVDGMIWDLALTKLDAIIAEQVSIRDDLTTALEAIWDKVKNI